MENDMDFSAAIAACTSAAVSVVVCLISVYANHKNVKKQCKSSLKALQRENELSIRRDALLYEYKQKFELTVKLVTDVATAVEDVATLFPEERYELDSKARQRELECMDYLKACDSYDRALEVTKKHAAFLPRSLYEGGMSLLGLCSAQIHSRHEMLCSGNKPDSNGRTFEDCR